MVVEVTNVAEVNAHSSAVPIALMKDKTVNTSSDGQHT